MADERLEQELKLHGFLAPGLGGLGAYLRHEHASWFKLTSDLNLLGQRRLMAATDQVISLSQLDPRHLTARLLMRSMSSFQAGIILLEKGMTKEALMMARNNYEHALWVAGLIVNPAETVEALKSDEMSSQTGRRDLLRAVVEQYADAELSKWADSVITTLPGPKQKGVRLSTIAKNSGTNALYLFFRQLSATASHPSLDSLDHFLARNKDGEWENFVLGPDVAGMEHALTISCHALLVLLSTTDAQLGDFIDHGAPDLVELGADFKQLAKIPDDVVDTISRPTTGA